MKWEDFLRRFASCPIIEPSMVYVGQPNPQALQAQLSRWVRSGRLVKLARGKYMLAQPYRRMDPPMEYVANALVYPSYVSLERALAWYGLIPEAVPLITSVTPGRMRRYDTPVGRFSYRHIHPQLFWGYETVEREGLPCSVALPEKALLDLVHLWRGEATRARIGEMRFQNLEALVPERLIAFADRAGSRRIRHAARMILAERAKMAEEYERL